MIVCSSSYEFHKVIEVPHKKPVLAVVLKTDNARLTDKYSLFPFPTLSILFLFSSFICGVIRCCDFICQKRGDLEWNFRIYYSGIEHTIKDAAVSLHITKDKQINCKVHFSL